MYEYCTKYPDEANLQTESRLVISRRWEERVMGYNCVTGTDFLFEMVKKIQGLD